MKTVVKDALDTGFFSLEDFIEFLDSYGPDGGGKAFQEMLVEVEKLVEQEEAF